jgi:hypothetical protein
MIEITVLEKICECELGVEVEDVTDAQIVAWINQALKDDRSQDSLIEAKMKKMKMNVKINSPAIRVTDLYVQFNKIVKDNGWNHYFEDDDGKKMKIRFIVNAKEPKELKKMIKNKLKIEPKFAKQPTAFLTLLRDKAVSHEETRAIMNDERT